MLIPNKGASLEMLAKCANPSCLTPFRYLESGRLFRLESDSAVASDPRTPEYFWLCRGCAATMSLRFDEGGGITVVLSRDEPPRSGEDFTSVVLDRKKGLRLNRISFSSPASRRRQRPKGGHLHDERRVA